MKEKKYIKIPKNFFKGLKFKVKVPKLYQYHEWCPECKAWRDEQIKVLLAHKEE